MNNLAVLHQDLGAYGQAERLHERALRIREAALGRDHPDVAMSLNNLAELHRARGAYAQAEPLYERALRVHEAALGGEHPDVATSLDNLAGLHQTRGAFAAAEPLCTRALQIRESALGAEHPDVATSLHNLASLSQAQGAYPEAERLYQRAVRIREAALGGDHPDVATSLNNLAALCWASGDAPRALRLFANATARRERYLALTLPVLPEGRKRQLLQTALVDSDVLVSFHAHGAPEDAGALALALTTTLRRKGPRARRGHARASRDAPRPVAGAASRARRPAGAPRRAGDAPPGSVRPVGRRTAPHARGRPRATRARPASEVRGVSRARGAAPAGGRPGRIAGRRTLVEFVRYQRHAPGGAERWREARYVAYMLQREGPPRWVALGDAETIDAAVSAALSALARPEANVGDLLRHLDELVLAPVRRALGPTQRFLLSPDAALHLVPFAALVDEDMRHLVERVHISYVTSGRDLVRTGAENAARARPLVVAAPAYEGRHAPLPGAEAEAGALRRHFPDIDLHVGPLATKDKLTAARGPLFVHVATHGFARSPRASAPLRASRCWRDRRDIAAILELPSGPAQIADVEDALDGAGLILAGASETDACLTAREITGIDLRGTQLVVLSALQRGSRGGRPQRRRLRSAPRTRHRRCPDADREPLED